MLNIQIVFVQAIPPFGNTAYASIERYMQSFIYHSAIALLFLTQNKETRNILTIQQ
jgi:hypothetical protein